MSRFRGFAAALMLATALAGATVGLLGASTVFRIIVVSLALAACALGGSVVSSGDLRRFALLAIVALVVMGFYAWHLFRSPSPFPLQTLDVAVLLAYGAVLLATVLWLFRIRGERALLLSFSIAVPLFIADALLPSPRSREKPQWQVSALTDPPLRFRYRPNSTGATYYADNPRGYFSTDASPRNSWALQINDASTARLEFSESEPGRMRVSLTTTSETEPWQVRLVQAPFEIRAFRRYEVRFLARADAQRRIACGVDRNRAPWRIAPYLELQIEPEWQSFECPFVASGSESNARILFDLAFSDVPVEFRDVVMRDVSKGFDLAPRPRHFVSYRFNAQGFRGPDYAIPAPDGTFRILALGDSFTLGMGVHEQDTFSAQLESRLNAGAGGQSTRYEVINAGVAGYSTEQERLSYELFSAAYLPQVVLLTMVSNDDLAFVDEAVQGFIPEMAAPPVSNLWARIDELRQPRRTYDYSSCVRELLALQESCQGRGARLAVLIFRIAPWEPWRQLVDQVTESVRGTDIPVLDLGTRLLEDHRPEELTVHPEDPHPNEIAHRLAAEEIERFLRAQGLLP